MDHLSVPLEGLLGHAFYGLGWFGLARFLNAVRLFVRSSVVPFINYILFSCMGPGPGDENSLNASLLAHFSFLPFFLFPPPTIEC